MVLFPTMALALIRSAKGAPSFPRQWDTEGLVLEHQPLTQTPRFLQTAEMVKPSTPSPSHESSSSSGSDEGAEYYPHLGERGWGEGGNPERAGEGGAGRSARESREEASGLSATASEGPLRHQGHGP